MESNTDSATGSDGGITPDAAASRKGWSTATRCYVMGLVWGFVGFALTYLSYNHRMVVLEDGAISVVRNDQGMMAGYFTMGFAALWVIAGIVLSLRRGGTASA